MCSYLHAFYLHTVQCAGLYDRKFEKLHYDRHAGGTTPEVLYRKVKTKKTLPSTMMELRVKYYVAAVITTKHEK